MPPAAAAVDEAVPGLPGVVMTRPGPLVGFLAALRAVLNDTGRRLAESGGRIPLAPAAWLVCRACVP